MDTLLNNYKTQVFEDNVNFSSDEDNPPVVDDTQLENNIDLCNNSMYQMF